MLTCSSIPWETDADLEEDLEYKEQERDKRRRYSKGCVCPLCGEPMTNSAETCIDCLPLQMSNPIIAAERQQRRLERLRTQFKSASRQQATTILATRLWQGPKRAAMIAKIQKLKEMEAKIE